MIFSDLPTIQIKRHRRANKLKLRVEPTRIVLIAPIYAQQQHIQSFIKHSEEWLLHAWQTQRLGIDDVLPERLSLFNITQNIHICYQFQKQNYIFDAQTLRLCISDRAPKHYLQTFILDYAKQYLPCYLEALSRELRLPYQKCRIRLAKTRWGSCSREHHIMLNAALVLYSVAAVRYVCVHELIHTLHFNHSAAFWAVVTQHDPEMQQHRQQLKNHMIPQWLLENT